MEPKLLTRDAFREGVFLRDGHKCVFCDKPAVDAHHILERRLWPDFGYYLSNGASVCEEHHLACERTTISVEDVRYAAGITRLWVPPHLYDDHIYDKWGNPVLEDGRRGKGELFFDESVQKVLQEVLPLFTSRVKYPRTNHLPWSPGVNDDDRVMSDLSYFVGKRVIVTRKMDGENTTMYSDHIHARSIDSRGGEDRAWVKQFWASMAHDIPENWRICGENLWAEHSIHYDDLPSFFMGFSVWDERNICLSWDDTLQYFELFGIHSVPLIYDGIWDESKIRLLEKQLNWDSDEGYVVRLAESFNYGDFKRSIAKYVRKGHVQTTKHWRAGRAFTPNKLISR
jgi:RNA ligase